MKRKHFLPLLPLILLLGAWTCNGSAAIKTSRGVAASLVALQTAEITLHTQKLIDDPEHKQVQDGFIVLAQTGQNVNNCIGAGGGAACVDPAIGEIEVLINSPIAGIKNPQSKAQITVAAKALEAALVTLKGAL